MFTTIHFKGVDLKLQHTYSAGYAACDICPGEEPEVIILGGESEDGSIEDDVIDVIIAHFEEELTQMLLEESK